MEQSAALHDQSIKNDQPVILRFVAHLFSFLFHPLFVPTYVTLYLLYLHPYAFVGINDDKYRILKSITVFFTTACMPALSIFLMKKLGFIQSVFLRTQRDRVIPYIIVMIFYFSVWYLSKIQPDNPSVFVVFMLSTFIASIVGLMANIYFKISMHGMAMGSLFTFFAWMAITGLVPMGVYLAIAILIAGLVCTSRLIVSDHNAFEVYTGLLAGIVSMLLAIAFS